jgi:hypothetical protein
MAGKHALEKKTQPDGATRAGRSDGEPPDSPPDDQPEKQGAVEKSGLHPAVAPAVVTLVAVFLVVGIGWLNRSGEPGPASLARPLANGQSPTSERESESDAASVRAVTPSGTTSDAGVVTTRGTQALLLPTWMDIPLVTPAIALRPEAADTMIPGAEATTVPPRGSGSGSGSGSSDGTTSPTTAGPTVTPSTVATPTTQPPVTSPPTTVTPTT